MPSPSTSLATLRPAIAGSFMEFELAMDRAGFIAPRVLPSLEVAKASGPFGKIPIEQLLANRDTERAPGSGYSRGKFTFTTDTYSCIEHGAEEPVDDNESKMYADYFDAEQIAADRAMDVVLRNYEKRVAAAVFNASTWSATSAGTEWSTITAVPITNINAAKIAVWNASGMWPNALIINRQVAQNLTNVTQILDRIKYSGLDDPKASGITAQVLAQVFDLDMVIIAGAAKNTAIEGQAASMAAIWSNEYAMIAKIATGQDIKEPCIGRSFHWAEDGSSIGGTVESYREEQTRSNILRVRQQVDEKILYVEAGELLDNITA